MWIGKIDKLYFRWEGNLRQRGFFLFQILQELYLQRGEHLLLAGTPVSAQDTTNPKTIRHIVQKMKEHITSIYPNFNDKTILWPRPMAWKLVESVVKEPGKVWRQKNSS